MKKIIALLLICIFANLHIYTSASAQCDTIFSFPTIDNVPTGLAFDGTLLYSTGYNTKLIYKFSLNGQLVSTIPNPTSLSFPFYGGGVDFDGSYLWMVVDNEAKAYKMDTANGNVLFQFNIPTSSADPESGACAFDNGYLWVTEFTDKTLMRMDANTGMLIDSFAINRSVVMLKMINDNLYGIEFVNGLATGPMQLDKFDKTTGIVTDSFTWCIPSSYGFAWVNGNMWGLSGGFSGTKRIYQFGSSPLCQMQSNIRRDTNTITINFGDSMVVGSNVYKDSGTYIDTFTAANGCDSIITTNLTVLTGITDVSWEFGMQIVPNPFSENAELRIQNAEFGKEKLELRIYDLLGRKVKTLNIKHQTTDIERGNLPNGIYFFEIENIRKIIGRGKMVIQ